MRARLLVVPLAAIAIGCSPAQPSHVDQTNQKLAGPLSVSGPSSLAPGATGAYTATSHLADGSIVDYTTAVEWRTTDSAVLSISPTGKATGQGSGDVQVVATMSGISARASVLVIPSGTYRLTGVVTETKVPVSGATVEVTSGVGTGLTSVTGADGQYRIYGVAGAVHLRVMKDSYPPVEQDLSVIQPSVADFELARSTRSNFAGTYDLTISADEACPSGTGSALPSDVRTRRYTATVTQDGASFHVTLGGANFVVQSGYGNGFSGTVLPSGITFELTDGYYGGGPEIVESLGNGQVLVIVGQGELVPLVNGEIMGALHASFYVGPSLPWSPAPPSAQCWGPNSHMVFTPTSASASRIRR